jgi:hypothetical protein
VPLDAIARELSRTEDDLTLTWEPFASRAALREISSHRQPFDLIHLDMHGRVTATASVSGSTLLLKGESGPDATKLGEVLRQLNLTTSTCLVSTSCEAAHTRSIDAARLPDDMPTLGVSVGAGCVIATSRRLRPAEASCFTAEFYRSIESGTCVAVGLRRARAALAALSQRDPASAWSDLSFSLTIRAAAPGEGIATSIAGFLPAALGDDDSAPAGPPASGASTGALPVPVQVVRQLKAGGGRVVIQTTRTEATALLAGLRFWIPRLRNPPELEVLAETTCAELELAEPITDRRIRVWNLTASEIPPFRPSPPHGRLAMPTGDGVEVIITTLAPQSFGGPKRTDREWPVPRLSTAPFEPPHVSSPSEVGDALRRWLLFDESPPPSTVDLTKLGATVQSLASRSREATTPPAAASEALSASTPPTPAGVDDCDIGAVNDRIITLLEEELDGPLPLDELTSFTVGLLLSPRDDDGNPSAPLREFAKIIHRLGLAHPIGSGTPQVLAYTPSLRAAVLGATSRRYLSGSPPTRNGWATTELHAIAPDFRYDNPKDPPDHKILTDRLIDLSWSTGNASAYRRVAGANRVALAALCAAGGHQPPAHWPGGQTWFGELAPIVELIERSVQGLPRHPADEYPRPAKRGKIHILGVENPTRSTDA